MDNKFIIFNTWNPFKEGLYFSFVAKFTNKDYPEKYILIGLFFFQLIIDFENVNTRRN